MEEKQTKSGLALAGLILGIIGVVLSAIPIINNFAFVLGVLALIFGIVVIVKSKKTGAKKGMAIASLVLGIVTVLVVILSQMMFSKALDEVGKAVDEASDSIDRATGGQTDDVLAKDVTVEFADFTAKTDEYGLVTTKLPVTVTNKLDEKKSYSITIEALDADGARIAEDTIYANDLGPDQTQKFEAFEYVESDKVDAMKAATFKVSSASQS